MKYILQPIERKQANNENNYLKDSFDLLDLNTGNLLFATMVAKQLRGFEEIYWNEINGQQSCKCTQAVIPCANFFIPGKHKRIGELIHIFNSTDCPITLIGLGAQASIDCETPDKLINALEKETIYLFQLAAERSKSIGVRGEFTAECLNKIGVKNVEVIGCPSFYFKINKPDIIGREISAIPSLQKVTFNITRNQEAWQLSDYEAKMLKWGMNIDGTYIMQMLSETTITPVLNKLCPKNHVTVGQAINIWPERIKFFLDYKVWEEYLESEAFTFSVGSRFHGNMAAFHAGIPSLWVVHDMRTKELVKALHLPYVSYKKVLESQSLEELVPFCDYTENRKCEKRMYRKYIEFLRDNNLDSNFAMI